MFGVPKFSPVPEDSSYGSAFFLPLVSALLVSAGCAVYLLGAQLLDVNNTEWIWGDLSLIHLAWVQMLTGNEDGWLATSAFSFPLPLSVALFDPLPIFMVPAQWVFSSADVGRQYLGWYFVACVTLQAAFGFLATDRALRMAGVSRHHGGGWIAGWVAMLLATTPYTFNRFQAHTALSSQWVLLLAVWVSLISVGAPRVRWLVLHAPLTIFLSGVNPYLAIMGLVTSLVLGSAGLRPRDWREFLLRSVVLSVVWVGGAWLFGFLGAAGLSTEGYGVYSMNLLGPLDSNGRAFFLPFDVSDATHGQTWEGFNYLGMGAILLVLAGGVALVRNGLAGSDEGPKYGVLPLVSVLLVATLFLLLSLSARVSVGAQVFEIPLPEGVMVLLGKFRGTGRFFWITGFLLVLVSAVVLARWLELAWVKLLLAALVVVQLLDIRPIALFVRESMQTAVRYPPLALGPVRPTQIQVHPPWQCDPTRTPVGIRNYESIGYAAVAQQVPSNNFYAARNPAEQVAYHCDANARLATVDPEVLYVLNQETYVSRKALFESSHRCQKEQMHVTSTSQQQLLSGLPVDQVFWMCRPRG